MAENDFDDKDIENDEFADEFDFVDEEHGGAPASAAIHDEPAQGKMPGNNKNYMMYGAIAAVVLFGAFAAYKFMSPSAKPEQTAQATPPAAPSAAGTPSETQGTVADNSALATQGPQNPPSAPLPPPVQTSGTAASDVDFNQSFDRATAAQDQLANAIPQQSKTFEQVQRDLKGSNAQVATAKAVIPDEINATLDSISEEMTLNVNQIKHLETTITNLAATVEQLNKSISAMDNRVLGLTETVDGLAQDLSNVKKVMAEEDLDLTGNKNVRFSGKKQQPISSSSNEYTVHAIIPGRAWLKNSAGQIITVTEGDKVGDFGTVAVIDATNGVVRTSSGITFR